MSIGEFPYGRAPLVLLVLAILSGLTVYSRHRQRVAQEPDLVMAIFAINHEEAYRDAIRQFEAKHKVRVQLQVVSVRALQTRLQSAMLTGARVPDLVEIPEGSMGVFARGPLADVGFVDLTARLHEEGLYDRMVVSRYSLWSSRGHIFALPHDVHPVALAYRRDVIEELGIDVDALKTWDDFIAMGRRVSVDLDGDGVKDRYAINLPFDGGWGLGMMFGQRGGGLFDEAGNVVFDSPLMTDTIMWYLRMFSPQDAMAYDAGWGQSLVKSIVDGLVLFHPCPDWRTKVFEMEMSALSGKMGLIPLPVWEPGGRRTATWGGSGLAITRASKNQRLAWELAKTLYLEKEDLAERFRSLNILPPLIESWSLDALHEPREFWGGMAIGDLYAELAPEAPPVYSSPYYGLASSMLSQAYLTSLQHYRASGEEGLREVVDRELKKGADYVRRVAARNVFLQHTEGGHESE